MLRGCYEKTAPVELLAALSEMATLHTVVISTAINIQLSAKCFQTDMRQKMQQGVSGQRCYGNGD